MDTQKLRDKPIVKYQQGDVLIRQVDVDRDEIKRMEKLTTNVVVPSSNPHTIDGGNLYRDKDTQALFLVSDVVTTFSHREHTPVKVNAGVYFIEPKVEVDFLSDMVRPVQD